MCEYCKENAQRLIGYSDSFDELTEVTITEDGNIRLKIYSEGFCDEKINFCPMCGRKL